MASVPAPPPPAPVLTLPDPAEHAARASLQQQLVQATAQMSSLSRQISEPQQAPPRPSSKMLAFLRRLGLDHYAHGLRREEVDLDVLATMDDAELVQMGVATVGARKRLRQALDEYKRSGRLLAADAD